jgi:CrcB protein
LSLCNQKVFSGINAMLRNLLIVGIGGFLGSITRYLSQIATEKIFSILFPAGIFIVNILGCLLIGIVYALSERGNILTAEMRLFLAVGFCGGFTTFSTFSYDNLMLLKDNSIGLLLLNTFGSVAIGLLAVYAGIVLIRIIF